MKSQHNLKYVGSSLLLNELKEIAVLEGETVTHLLRLKTAVTTDTGSRITSDKILIFKNCTYINQREKSCSLNHLCTDKADCRRNERTDRGESETMGNGVKWLRWKN